MPPLTIKRKDPLVKATRRNATRLLDAAIQSLTGSSADPASARRELRRLQALLHLIRRPLTSEIFTREHRVIGRSLKLLPGEAVLTSDTLTALAAIEPALNAAGPLGQLAGAAPKRRKKNGPDPKQLRLVADLAEMRMRARYWHLPEGGFELLAPGLRQSYQRAAKLSRSSNQPAEFAATLSRLADQLQAFERAWPDLLGVTRKSLRRLERQALKQADLVALRPHLHDHAELLARLDDQLAIHHAAASPLGDQLFVETPTAFAKRLAGIWNAWRA